jgi:hypothetical protein
MAGSEKARTTLMVWVVALIPLTVGTLAAFVGAIDLSSALTFGARLVGGVLLFLGIVSMLSPIGMFFLQRSESNAGGLVALASASAASLFGFLLIILQIVTGGRLERLLIWLPMTVASLACCYLLVTFGRVRVPRPKLTALVSATAALALIGFLRSNVYEPGVAPQVIAVSAIAGKPTYDPSGEREAIPVEFKVENRSSVRIHIPASNYSVLGRSVRERAGGNLSDEALRGALENGRFLSRYIGTSSFELLQADRLFSEAAWLEPGEVMSSTKIIRLPSKAPYDELFVNSAVFTVRGDRAAIVPGQTYQSWDEFGKNVGELPRWMGQPEGTRYIYTDFQIKESSMLRAVVRQPMVATSYWIVAPSGSGLSGGTYGQLVMHPKNETDPSEPSIDKSLEEYSWYGLAIYSQFTEVSLWRATAPPSR